MPWAITLLAVALSGCTPKSAPVSPNAPYIRFQVSSEPISLDPSLVEDGNGLRLIANLMDGLVGYDGAGQLRFLLAESVKTSDDGLRYEFAIRPEATWSDGTPVLASQFVTAFRRALDPTTGSKLAEMLYAIRGARAVARREIPPLRLGVHAMSSHRLAIELEHPLPTFLEVLTLPQAMPLRDDVLAAHGGKWPLQAPVTGAYVISASRLDQMLQLEPNERYWDKRPLNPIQLTVVQDESTAVRLFDQGKLDVLTRIPTLEYERLRQTGRLVSFPMIATYFVAFDTRTPPFNDVKWRRRFSAAVDRQGIIQALGSNEFPALSWVPRGLEGALETTNLPPLLLTAKKESTPQSGAKISPVTLTFDSSGRNSLIVEKIQNDVQRATGLRITLEPADWKTHVRRMREDPRHIYRFGWLAPFVDPISHLRAFTSDNPNNYTGWKDSAYDALVERIARTPRGPAREALIRQADRRLVEEEAVVVPIYHYVQDYGVSPRIKGFRAAPNGVIRFAEMSF